MMDPVAELKEAEAETARAADAILVLTEAALVRAAEIDNPATRDALQQTLCAVIQACAFQDLTGQRMAKVRAWLGGIDPHADPLMEGPQMAGAGLDQAAADALFAG